MKPSNSVILYSGHGCANCQRLKATFNCWGIEFEEKNVTEDPALMSELIALGFLSIPVVRIGDRSFVGYRPEEIRKELAIGQANIST